ncbi:NAD(P)/FAD-dependent oxidoreductase [Pontivivens ytuae]|uniref:FAD-binding oxidoreductase n=1 Tax=Pontivivens ytuae TaxID=2789856 RepID=A0A7S9LRX0_9RHOB|nr:FAD-binding oxidoreductase [Pontivivens ytuae]QPH53860.1 FAD-binding oxidoreductase [Pontivivens ytuae]
MSERAEILVIGAGVFGLWTALRARQAGHDVLVVEAGPAPGHGASGGLVGALAPHMPERWNAKKQFQLEALLALGPALAEVERLSGLPTGYGRIGRLVPLATEAARMRAGERAVEAAERWGDAARLEVLPGDAYPRWLSVEAAPQGIAYDTLTGRLNPAATCAALAGAFLALGGRLEVARPVTEVAPGRVETSSGPILAERIVVAAGVAGFDLLAPLVGEVAGRGEKGQALLLEMEAPDLPLLYADGLYVIPHATGGVAVGATSERDYDDPRGTDAQLDAVLERARTVCPRLGVGRVVARWAGERPRANGRDPMVGAVPGGPGVFAAMGGFKIGFGLGEKVGAMLARELAGEDVGWPESFRVEAHLGL